MKLDSNDSIDSIINHNHNSVIIKTELEDENGIIIIRKIVRLIFLVPFIILISYVIEASFNFQKTNNILDFALNILKIFGTIGIFIISVCVAIMLITIIIELFFRLAKR